MATNTTSADPVTEPVFSFEIEPDLDGAQRNVLHLQGRIEELTNQFTRDTDRARVAIRCFQQAKRAHEYLKHVTADEGEMICAVAAAVHPAQVNDLVGVKQAVHRSQAHCQSTFRQHMQTRRLLQQSIKATERDLASAKQKVAMIKAQPSKKHPVDQQQVHDALVKMPIVEHVKSWTKNNGAQFCIRLHLKNIFMANAHPDWDTHCKEQDRATNIDSDGYFLEPMALSLIFEKNKLNPVLLSLRGTRFKCYEDRDLVHPHWLHRDSPCFGDFGGPIGEAISTGDITLLIMLYLAFLEQFDPQDSAGKFASRWDGRPTSKDHITEAEKIPEECEHFLLSSNPQAASTAGDSDTKAETESATTATAT